MPEKEQEIEKVLPDTRVLDYRAETWNRDFDAAPVEDDRD